MRSLGFRAEADAFNWAVAEGTLETPVLIASDKVIAPANDSIAEKLNFFRNRVLQLIDEHKPNVTGVRTPENLFGKGEGARKRLRLEGVLMAANAERGIPVVSGPLATLNAALGTKAAKKLLTLEGYRQIDWSKLSSERREAVLMSVSQLRTEE